MIRPLIVLPRWALSLPKKDLELVILHEREHREARDPAILGAGLLLTALSSWNPALWWMLKRLHLAVEGDCDRAPSTVGTVFGTAGARYFLYNAEHLLQRQVWGPS